KDLDVFVTNEILVYVLSIPRIGNKDFNMYKMLPAPIKLTSGADHYAEGDMTVLCSLHLAKDIKLTGTGILTFNKKYEVPQLGGGSPHLRLRIAAGPPLAGRGAAVITGSHLR
ncbi:uncharacterized protein LOC126453083, partial [Schistocerca serialis cubense]|uniref:uncharacterized protein LOC126453083 n=1 Tax=Schistocerca serialis cubense TaxID=2023355 RepID=UPI00214E08D2